MDRDNFTYDDPVRPLDSIARACALCHTPVYFNKTRSVPDELCMSCYNTWKDQRFEPWLVHLCRREAYRRLKLLRLRKRGINYLSVSYEDYLKSEGKDYDDGDPFRDDPCYGLPGDDYAAEDGED